MAVPQPKPEAATPAPKKVSPVVGKNQKAFLMSEMTPEQKASFLNAKAPEHSKQYNHECD